MKLGEERPSKYCKCKQKGHCFDRVEKVMTNEDGSIELAWCIHCKTMERICRGAMGQVRRILKPRTLGDSQ